EDTDAALTAAFSARSENLTVLYSGRLVERKGIRELLAAIPEVLQAVPGARFVMTGGPPPFSPAAVAAQRLEPKHSPFLDRIHFTGWQSPAQMALRRDGCLRLRPWFGGAPGEGGGGVGGRVVRA